MAVETAKDSIRISQIVAQKQETITVEGDIIVNDVKPDVLKIINTNGTICIYKKEISDGKIKIEGCINTYVIYLADDEMGSVRSLCTSLDFTRQLDIEECTEQMSLDEKLVIKEFETKILNGRKIQVKAFIDTSVKVYSNNSFEIISSIENEGDMQILNSTEKIISLIGEGNSKTFAKDTIAIEDTDDLAEIMRVDFNILDEETKVSYNKVLVKANAEINIMYLTEDNRINTIKSAIPIMGFIDLQNISENSICDVRSELRNLIIKPNNNEEHSIYVDAEIELSCNAYETREINIIEDIYSIANDVSFTQNSINAMTEKCNLRENYTLNQQITMPELVNGKILNTTLTTNVVNMETRKNKVIYEGNVNIEFIYEYNNDIGTNVIKIPFNFEILSDTINNESIIESNIQVSDSNIQIFAGDNITVKIELGFSTLVENNRNINVIDNINVEEPKTQDDYSMVIYFVKPGDTLWKIAKKFKSRVEDIARINNIENENKICIGMQLYIPKFTRYNISA